ncbi:MAG: hypothetical protein CVU11_03350 [Bacteroidetes bacterium HGW-Bacteroidetes-6]|jgi:hypothetical protein|nr:MAG: hypothetical protein CVU11_03350 [Bacteroidetes bacterium HGW-Bacteroidetes-6]
MKKLISILFFGILFISAFGQSSDSLFGKLIAKCADFSTGTGNYKCEPYLDLASYVQSLEPTQAIFVLTECAKTGKFEDQMIVLTKMLFESKNDSPFRRPMIGGAIFLGNTTYDDWTSEPIEIINNVPFLITRGYFIGGLPESSLHYLEYCMENGVWTAVVYKTKTEDELNAALKTLLNGSKWKKELSKDDVDFFKNQIN